MAIPLCFKRSSCHGAQDLLSILQIARAIFSMDITFLPVATSWPLAKYVFRIHVLPVHQKH